MKTLINEFSKVSTHHQYRPGNPKTDTKKQKMLGSGAHTGRERQGHRNVEGTVTG